MLQHSLGILNLPNQSLLASTKVGGRGERLVKDWLLFLFVADPPWITMSGPCQMSIAQVFFYFDSPQHPTLNSPLSSMEGKWSYSFILIILNRAKFKQLKLNQKACWDQMNSKLQSLQNKVFTVGLYLGTWWLWWV